MAKNSRDSGANSWAETSNRITYGEVFEDGIIDVVASTNQNGLDLLFYAGEKVHVAQEINHRGVLYRTPDLDLSIRQALRFPPGVTAYRSFTALFTNVVNLYREHFGLPEEVAIFAASWIFSSWIPELMVMPLTMCVTATASQVRNLHRLFRCLCRRPLMVAELSRRLPFYLHPTLLIDDPKLSPKACAFWSAANSHGVVVPEKGGRLCELTCSKAVRLHPQDSADLWGEDAAHLVLLPTEFSPLSDRLLEKITSEFQPQLEMYRLRRLTGMERVVPTLSQFADFELARNLFACLPDDAEIVGNLTLLLESHRQEVLARRSRNPQLAIVEAVWVPAHSPGKMSVGEITERVNAILRARDEMYVFNSWEIGWLLRKLHLHSRSTREGRVLRFSTEICRRLHQLARELGLKLPIVPSCEECKEPQAIEAASVV